RLQEIVLRTVRLPLIRPYVLSYRTFTEFEPIIVEVRDGGDWIGWGEGHISPGSSSETRDGGWTFCREYAAAVIGKDSSEAKAIIARNVAASKVAATALLTAIEMLERHPLLTVERETRLPLLTAFSSSAPGDIEREVEQSLKDGFRTFKIKVGKSAEDDARRVKLIQRAIAGRATMRLDANRAYSEAEACRFVMTLDPAGIELFEQPCPAEDWEANARVASVSPVPLMLDEPICTLADVKRASAIANVGFCKLKLKRFGGLDLLREALDAVHEWGMEAVLGDGLSSEVGCWMEACIARVTIRNAGEFNGFLKPNVRLFTEPLRFVAGELVLPLGFTPTIDADTLAAHEITSERFMPTTAGWTARIS
ncbi:MAG TPA: enolase C-terminal domain-like protein, partial [Candidatus Eremiobacteraceae bacterium]|nr:enolase C-terminal domain-like protein [Candidatus Eremiobacteraceae bacterium]